MEEIRKKRTRTSKTYQLANGKKRLEVGGPHRHCRVAGQWEKTDIKAVAPPLNTTTNAHGTGFTHYYPKALVPIEIDRNTGAQKMDFGNGASICLGGMPNLNGDHTGGVTPTISRSFTDFDVKYIAKSTGIKRWWRLKKATPGNIRTFTSPVKCIKCSVVGNKVISETGKILAEFDTPFCYEESSSWNPLTSDGEHKPVGLEVSDTEMIVTVDTTGMSFPIIVDPTLTVATSSADNFLSEIGPTLNYGSLTVTGCYGLTNNAQRPLHLMDFTALPAGATITSAIFSLYCNLNNDGFAGTIECWRITQAWVEGTAAGVPQAGSSTWDDYGAGAWAAPGGDVTATDMASTAVPTTGTWADWTVTALAQWSQINNGKLLDVLVRLTDEANPTVSSSLQFYSKENASSNKPKLVIEYTEADAGGGPINAPISGPISAPIVAPIGN